MGSSLRYTGIDILQSNIKKEFQYVRRNSENFKEIITNNTQYDLIISTFSLHHFQYPVTTLHEINNLLKEEGLVFFMDLQFDKRTDAHLIENLINYNREIASIFLDQYHRHPYTLEEALDLFIAMNNVTVIDSYLVNLEYSDSEKNEVVRYIYGLLEEDYLNIMNTKNNALAHYFKHTIPICKNIIQTINLNHLPVFIIIGKKTISS